MKNNYTFKSLFIAMLFAAQAGFAQLPVIDSLKIIPTNPTTNDVVKLVAYATFSSGGCVLTGHNVQVTGNNIRVNLVYTVGMATYICHSTDTLTLGSFAAGNYTAIAMLSVGSTIGVPVLDTINFTVQSVSGINNINNSASIQLYPNPVENELHIQSDVVIENVELYSTLGQQVLSFSYTELNENKISLETLPDGIYMIVITDKAKQRYVKKLVKK